VIVVDGSIGEGGGQILRTALGLSLVTGKPFRIEKIRAGRQKPGLLRQHLTAVEAAVQIGQAKVDGKTIGSQALSFEPGTVIAGEYHFSIGTAGSATLVLQTILPALLMARKSSKLIIEGGTHNPYAPPFDFLNLTFLPILNQMGATVDIILHRPGFYPAGGGKIEINVIPSGSLNTVHVLERGDIIHVKAKAMVAQLSKDIGLRELNVIKKGLSCKEEDLELVEIKNSLGPGNIVVIEVKSEKITEVFVGFGELGKAAEAVAHEAVDMTQKYLQSNVPVGRFLADQLLIPLVLAKGGTFRTLAPSRHSTTNVEIIRKFLDVDIKFKEEGHHQFLVSVNSQRA
jgi:RNA 3'-terminal phosphate cyclase (ATP)